MAKTPLAQKPLGNESIPPSADELQKQLEDSREEVSRMTKSMEILRGTVLERDQQVEALVNENSNLKNQAPVNAVPAPRPLADDENYTGPTQKEIYLSLVSGMTGQLNPTKLDDRTVKDLAASFCGLSEVFFAAVSRRASFIRPA